MTVELSHLDPIDPRLQPIDALVTEGNFMLPNPFKEFAAQTNRYIAGFREPKSGASVSWYVESGTTYVTFSETLQEHHAETLRLMDTNSSTSGMFRFDFINNRPTSASAKSNLGSSISCSSRDNEGRSVTDGTVSTHRGMVEGVTRTDIREFIWRHPEFRRDLNALRLPLTVIGGKAVTLADIEHVPSDYVAYRACPRQPNGELRRNRDGEPIVVQRVAN